MIRRRSEFAALLKKSKRLSYEVHGERCSILCAASLHDINKMLAPKKQFSIQEIQQKLPKKLDKYLGAFQADKNIISDLPPCQLEIDISTEIEKEE